MKPTVISNTNTLATTGSGNSQTGENCGVRIPVKQEYRGPATNQHHRSPQAQNYVNDGPHAAAYGSPDSTGRCQRQQLPHSQHQQEAPARFQDFDFDPDVGLDMFPRTRLGRMTHDPFGDFGSTPRKRTSLHEPHFHTDGFSRYFDDAADFGFPQFNSLGRRRVDHQHDDDFFNRLPSEFRQYIPETFTHRRSGSGMTASPSSGPTKVEQQPTTQQKPESQLYNTIPETSSRKVCDAAIQTEDPAGRSEVDHATHTENLSQHGLRNTMDMGVKSPSEKENQSPRSSSAPPTELQQNLEQPIYTQPWQIPKNGPILATTPPQQQNQFATQTSPPIQPGGYGGQSPQFKKVFYVPHHTPSQQKQQTPPPQTLGGSNIRTIPIFVEGRTEPIINNKEIPNQNATASDTDAFTPSKQNSRGLPPLNTQQQNAAPCDGLPPQTPHTVDTINKIQDIQRDVLDLMSRVEKFTGTRADKEYVYLDEMLTRNLLKLDNIETNGKESIRLARKEAIKCIQASINVLEAKAEENKKANQNNLETSEEILEDTIVQETESPVTVAETKKSTSTDKFTKETKQLPPAELVKEPADNKSEPIPLPPPESEKFNDVKIEDCPEDDFQTTCTSDECVPNPDDTSKNVPN